MKRPETRYARASDGAYIAYQTVGQGPIDLVWQLDWFGDIDLMWEDVDDAYFYTELATFARVIFHDRRGTGLSSRNVRPPNLETRVADLLTVLDEVGAERPVVAGILEGGAPNALMAATHPDRVTSMVWIEPLPRSTRIGDYRWGRTSAEAERELGLIDLWGTTEYGRAFIEFERENGNVWEPSMAEWVGRLSRHTCTPDVARELERIWMETDVRGILPSVQAPALLMGPADDPVRMGLADYVGALLPQATVAGIATRTWTVGDPTWSDAIRRFVGAAAPATGLDTVLATVLFTDIVGSTERQSTIGDHAWKALVERHHAVVRGALERWRGTERDTAGDGFFATFDGPARAIRCGLEIVEGVRDLGIEVRAGVHTGECEVVDTKVGGVAVSIGARIMALSAPSEVVVSQTVRDLVAGSGFAFDDRGDHELRGVPERWRLYRALG